MKSDTERKKHYKAKLHKKRNDLHIHLSKELRAKMKTKKRSILVRTGDSVKILRGPEKGKDGKISAVDITERKVYVDGITVRNAKAKEIPLSLQPSNLMIVGLESTKERQELFSSEAFKAPKTEKKKEELKKEEKPQEKKKKEVPKPPKPAEAKEVPKAGKLKGDFNG